MSTALAANCAFTPCVSVDPLVLTNLQTERLQLFDTDPYDAIRQLIRSDAYASASDRFLDVEHTDHDPAALSRHIDMQLQRLFIDMVNNCDTGAEYEVFRNKLRYRFAGVIS